VKARFSVAARVLGGSRRSEARAQADSHERERIPRGKKPNADPTHRDHRNTRAQRCQTRVVPPKGGVARIDFDPTLTQLRCKAESFAPARSRAVRRRW